MKEMESSRDYDDERWNALKMRHFAIYERLLKLPGTLGFLNTFVLLKLMPQYGSKSRWSKSS
jgi:hypothetical protein